MLYQETNYYVSVSTALSCICESHRCKKSMGAKRLKQLRRAGLLHIGKPYHLLKGGYNTIMLIDGGRRYAIKG